MITQLFTKFKEYILELPEWLAIIILGTLGIVIICSIIYFFYCYQVFLGVILLGSMFFVCILFVGVLLYHLITGKI